MKAFKPSDLILTEQGAVYHLNLRPEDISNTIILVGDRDRVPLITAMFDEVELTREKREFLTQTGLYKGKRISVIATGIGTDNIDIVLNELDALANIDLVNRTEKKINKSLRLIRIGTCGVIQPDIPIGSFVVSDYGLGLDNLMHFYHFQNSSSEVEIRECLIQHLQSKEIQLPFYLFEADGDLKTIFDKGFFHGITITAPGFYGPQGRKLRYKLAFPGLLNVLASFDMHGLRILNFEMETSALFGLSKIFGHKAITIDLALANRLNGEATTDYKQEMKDLSRQVLDIIASAELF